MGICDCRGGGDAVGIGSGDGGDKGMGAAGVGDHAPGVRFVERDSAAGRRFVSCTVAGAAERCQPRVVVHAGLLRRGVGHSSGEGSGGE